MKQPDSKEAFDRQWFLGRLRIVSGGQTGVDRAALDWAIESGLAHGGWCPQGRLAEDGVIPAQYALRELPDGGYRKRTRANVEDSDGTLILNLGALEGGTLLTRHFAERLGKPWKLVQLERRESRENFEAVLLWLAENHVRTLNIAGPRESKCPGIHAETMEFLDAVRLAGQ
ncbi:putative molybdenum carrier protein [Microbulbifer halophilus]|uniref:Molybdenum carrier protein n=2 Tax=Microbulbifer halophilus TaxID=453963 RepID=A0ABW5EAY9_9GAMM|nr:putative molybdenum carrier protein [Microbulbifer halophilus]MCW8125111.1 putative molybdenum carrier protein [Microbulbifer halophilus]